MAGFGEVDNVSDTRSRGGVSERATPDPRNEVVAWLDVGALHRHGAALPSRWRHMSPSISGALSAGGLYHGGMRVRLPAGGRPGRDVDLHEGPLAPPPPTRQRPPLAPYERRALVVLALVLVGFIVHGVVHHVASTGQYVITIILLVTLVLVVRTRPIPAAIVWAGTAAAIVHLSGGLIRVGDGVLYNASLGPEITQFDHFGHSLGTIVGALVIWELVIRDVYTATGRRSLLTVTVLAALGLGALNETIEFIATLIQDGSNVGGYENTGWDLVTNTIAGILAGLFIDLRLTPRPPDNTENTNGLNTKALKPTGHNTDDPGTSKDRTTENSTPPSKQSADPGPSS